METTKNKTKLFNTIFDFLPSQLLMKILYSLLVRTLLQLMCVSKLSSLDFISTHLSHYHSSNSSPLLLLRHFSTRPKEEEKYSIYLDPSETENLTLVKELKFPFTSWSGNQFRVVGLCNGLFCLSDDLFLGNTDPIILWNPTIRKHISLPRYSCPYEPYMFSLGFGFDQKTHDFKVVRIVYLYDYDGGDKKIVLPPRVEVFILSSCLWKMVDSKDIRSKIIEYFYSSIYLDGAIHWVSYFKNEDGIFSNSLLVFNLSDEKFSELGLPQKLVNVYPMDLYVTLCRVGDQISMFRYKNDCDDDKISDHCFVWIMNKYGEMGSWIEKFVVVLKEGISLAIGFTRNYGFLLEKCVGDLVSFDPESKKFKDLGVHGGKGSFFLSEYVTSLVLLNVAKASADHYIASDSKEAIDAHPQILQYTHTEMNILMKWNWSKVAP